MATQWQFRRGTTAEHASFTGAQGEVTVDTTKKVVVVHDGSTAGGVPMAKASTTLSGYGITDAYTKNEVTERLYRKNLLINGNFSIWQRATSQTTTGYGSDDRWRNDNVGSTKTHSRVACGDTERPYINSLYYSRTVVTSVAGASNYVIKTQAIENGTALTAGKTCTLSFKAKADASKNIGIWLSQNFGTGGSTAIGDIGAQLVALTNAWQKFSITVDLPSIVGKTVATDNYLKIFFGFDIGSSLSSTYGGMIQQSGTFDIADVQFEIGAEATDFEYRHIAEELKLCKRYYQKVDNASGGNFQLSLYAGSTTTNTVFPILFPVEMRISPTLTKDGTWAETNIAAWIYVNANKKGFAISVDATAVGMWTLGTDTSDDAIIADAEL